MKERKYRFRTADTRNKRREMKNDGDLSTFGMDERERPWIHVAGHTRSQLMTGSAEQASKLRRLRLNFTAALKTYRAVTPIKKKDSPLCRGFTLLPGHVNLLSKQDPLVFTSSRDSCSCCTQSHFL